MHDTSKSAWFLLLALIPGIGAIILLIFACMDSQPGANQYGPKDVYKRQVYSPEAAEQSTEVTVNHETGEATPGKVIFTVVPEEAKAIEYVLYYRNTVDGQLLTQTETVSLEYPGEYTLSLIHI